MNENTFTVRQIRDWLRSWYLHDGDGYPFGSLPLTSILTRLESEEDGIEAWAARLGVPRTQRP